jgi:hypothetical protein
MSYVPKHAQRKMARYAKLTTPMAEQTNESAQTNALPRRLTADTPGCNRYQVWFDGVRQYLCTLADVDAGRIVRYKAGIGSRPSTREQETLHGLVEIRRR